MISPAWIIGFSGHRNLAAPERVKEALLTVFGELAGRIARQGGSPHFYTSVASGADLLAIAVADGLDIPVHLVLPLPEDEFAKDFENGEEWLVAKGHIDRALAGERGGTCRTLPGNGRRPDCYFAQALEIAEVCDLLVVVWDGNPSNGPGGTADVVDLARRLEKPVIRIDAESGALLDDMDRKMEEFPWPHGWPVQDGVMKTLADLERDSPDVPAEEGVTEAAALQRRLDAISNRRAPEFRRGVARAIWIHTLAALLGAIPSLFYFFLVSEKMKAIVKWDTVAEWFTAAELALVLIALVVTLVLHWSRTRQKWVTARFATEVVRGLRAASPWIDPLRPLVARHRPEWHRFALTAGILAARGRPKETPLETFREEYRRERLRDQAEHFRVRAEAARHRHHQLHLFAKWAAILAPFAVAFALVDKVWHFELTKSTWWGALFGKFLPVALPLTAASATAFRNSLDWTRRAHRYPDMADRLDGLDAALGGMKTWETAAAVVAKAEEILLDELIEWHLAARNSGAH